jgi:hypothetical protein
MQLTIRSTALLVILCGVTLTGCSHMTTGIGVSFPLGPFGSIGVGVNSDGRVGGSVGVGVGPAVVSVGTSGQLPATKTEPVAQSEPTTKTEPITKTEEVKKP